MGSPSTTTTSRRQHVSRPLPHPRFSGTSVPPRSTVYVVERLGRFSRLLHSASDAAPLLPFVDKVVAAYTTRRVEQTTPSSGVLALAAGRVQVHVHAAWTVKVLDPKRLAYRIADVDRCIHMLVHVRIRDALAALPPNTLHTLAAPNTLAAMSDAVRQNVDETAHKFGVACPALRISAITPVADAAETKTHHHPPKLPQGLTTSQGSTTQPPPQKPRSLNLAEPNAPSPIPSDPNEFDTVLPELPAHNSPVKLPLPPKFDDSSEDDDSVDDSSTENRPENMPVSPRDVAPRAPIMGKEVIYAPPPSPSQEHLHREMHTADMLPTLISRVLTRKEQLDDGNQIATDSSYDDLPPPLPPSPKPLPPSPPPSLPLPLPDDNVLNGDFTPDLAKYLDGLPPTPSTDLPSSEASSDPQDRAVDAVASRELPDEKVSMDTRFSRLPEEPDDGAELPEVHQESLPPFPFKNMSENPFDPVEPVGSVEKLQTPSMPTPSPSTPSMPTPSISTPSIPTPSMPTLPMSTPSIPTPSLSTPSMPTPSTPTPSMPTPSMLTPSMPTPSMRAPSTLTNPASAESLPIEEDSDCLSSKAVLDKDVDSNDDDPSSSSLPEPSRSLPVSSSVKREPRRCRQQLPTASVFQSVTGKAERAIKSATSDLIEGPMRMINTQSNTQRISGPAPTDAAPADGRRELPPRPAKMNARKPATRPAPRRIDGERRRNMPAMAEYQPEGRQLPPPLPTAMPVEQTQVFPLSAACYPTFPDFSDSSREHVGFREGMATSRHVEDSLNQRRVKDGDMDGRRKRREESALRSRREEEMLSSKEHSRREKLMDTLESIEKSQAEGVSSAGKFRDIENRDTWAEANSDTDQEVFFDAQDVVTSTEPTAPSEPRHSSRRRHKSRHARKSSRHEDGYYAEGSSEDECPECANRHYESYHHEEPHGRRGRSRSRSESAKRRVYDDDDDDESDSDVVSSRSHGRNEKRSGDSHRPERSEHSSRDRSHRSKKSSSREKKPDRTDRWERSERGERTETSERRERDKSERSERSAKTVVSERSEREHSSSRSKSEDRKRSHQKEKSKSSKKASRDAEPERERKRREPKSRSKKKHKRAPSPPPTVEYSNHCTEARSIYRHRLPDSDSGIENPIPWYCEGQSAPDDTDIELVQDRSSESESNAMNSVQTTTTYSSYGRRLKNGSRRRAHHTRTVTFLYDDL